MFMISLSSLSSTFRISAPHRPIYIKVMNSVMNQSDIQAEIVLDGKAVALNFPSSSNLQRSSTETSIFHAEWLWSNRISNITVGGQRLESAGSFHNNTPIRLYKISMATIHCIKDADLNNQNELGSLQIPVPPPRPDSVHPIEIEPIRADLHIDNQLILEIVWEGLAMDEVEYSQLGSSFYCLRWLERWRYDKLALTRLRSRTEVTPSHTFIQKWRIGLYSERNHDYQGLLDFNYEDIFDNTSLDMYDKDKLFRLMEVTTITTYLS